MKCNKCNAEIPEGTKVCPSCGEVRSLEDFPRFMPLRAVVICKECGEENDAKYEFCQNCGAQLGNKGVAKAQDVKIQENVSEKKSNQNLKKTYADSSGKNTDAEKQSGAVTTLKDKFKGLSSKRNVIIIVLASIVILIVVIAIIASLGKRSNKIRDHIFFVQDSDISVAAVNDNELTFRGLTDNYGSVNMQSNAVTLSDDGKGLFFIDNVGDGTSCALYYLDISGGVESGLPVRISSSLKSSEHYKVVANGEKVFFVRSDGMLCACDLKSVSELYNDVDDFWIDETGSHIIFTAGGGAELCEMLVSSGKAEIVDRNVSKVCAVSDVSVVIYLKDGSIYKWMRNGEKERIAADIKEENVSDITDNGEFYYVVSDSTSVEIDDFVNDTMLESDNVMLIPQQPEYPSTADYKLTTGATDWDKYHLAVTEYEEEMDKYTQAYADYSQKLKRDALREEMKGMTVQINKMALYYYNGKENILVNEVGCTPLSEITENGNIAYVRPKANMNEKINITEIERAEDVTAFLETMGGNDGQLYIACAGVEMNSGAKAALSCSFTKNGNRVLWIDSKGIWSVKLKEEKPESKLLLEGATEWFESDDGEILLFKKSENGFDIYSENGKLIDKNVSLDGIISDDKYVYYLTNCSNRTKSGTLRRLNGLKITDIDEDVYTFELTANGYIAYLVNYSPENVRGELVLWADGKKITIGEQISDIITVNGNTLG